MSRKCPASGCLWSVPYHALMCKPHWYMVPVKIRAWVLVAWAGGSGAGTDDHNSAVAAAIEAVNEKLAARGRS